VWHGKKKTGLQHEVYRARPRNLMEHSAGASHVATYVAHPEFHKVKDGGLKGVIMVSGTYDLTAIRRKPILGQIRPAMPSSLHWRA
jgi:hypothetical protein